MGNIECCTVPTNVTDTLPFYKVCVINVNDSNHLIPDERQFTNIFQEIALDGKVAVLDIWERRTKKFNGRNSQKCLKFFYEFVDMIVINLDLQCNNGLTVLKKNLVPELQYCNKMNRHRFSDEKVPVLLVGQFRTKTDAFRTDLGWIEEFCDSHEWMFKQSCSDDNNSDQLLEIWANFCNKNGVELNESPYCPDFKHHMQNLVLEKQKGDLDGCDELNCSIDHTLNQKTEESSLHQKRRDVFVKNFNSSNKLTLSNSNES